jgi:hypothetical protein
MVADSNAAAQSLALPLAQTSLETPVADPNLARVIVAWPNLPEPIRRAVLALVGESD